MVDKVILIKSEREKERERWWTLNAYRKKLTENQCLVFAAGRQQDDDTRSLIIDYYPEQKRCSTKTVNRNTVPAISDVISNQIVERDKLFNFISDRL